MKFDIFLLVVLFITFPWWVSIVAGSLLALMHSG